MVYTTIYKITHPLIKCQQFIYVQKYKNKKMSEWTEY